MATLAVGASLLTAVIVATSALIVALVNAWNARRMAYAEALRRYRQEMLTPALQEVEQWIDGLERIREGAPVSTMFRAERPSTRVIRVTPDDQLIECAGRFAFWRLIAWRVIVGEPLHVTQDERKWLVVRAFEEALVFREALENQIFGTEWGRRTFTGLAAKDLSNRAELSRLILKVRMRRAWWDGQTQLDDDVIKRIESDLARWPFDGDGLPGAVDNPGQ